MDSSFAFNVDLRPCNEARREAAAAAVDESQGALGAEVARLEAGLALAEEAAAAATAAKAIANDERVAALEAEAGCIWEQVLDRPIIGDPNPRVCMTIHPMGQSVSHSLISVRVLVLRASV